MINTGRKKLTAGAIAEGFARRNSETHFSTEVRSELPAELQDLIATLTSKVLEQATHIANLQSEVARIKAIMSTVGDEALKRVRA